MQYFAKCFNSKIFIQCGILENVPQLLEQYFNYDKAIILVDENVLLIHEHKIKQLSNSLINSYYISCPAGERAKSFTYACSLIEQIITHNLSKNSLIIAIGGGTIGDIAGFIASILNRGVMLIQIPTTLIAQIDSSIGGKNGLNIKQIKNKIGTIYPAELIITDPLFLATLNHEEIISGLVEVIKHGLINNLNLLKLAIKLPNKIKNNDYNFLESFIKKAAKVKIKIVNKDPYEKLGIRYILNLGHSFGHAIEGFCNEKRLSILHGEAVAIGLYLVYKFAFKFAYLTTQEQFIQLINIFTMLEIKYNLSKVCRKIEDIDIICNYLQHDKKNIHLISLILPIDGNKFKLIDNFSLDLIKSFLMEEFSSS